MEVQSFEKLEYIVNYPSGYKKGERYPVVLFLHGAGTRGEDIGILKNNKFMQTIGIYDDFSFITVAPHCKNGTWFDHFETLKRFAKSIASAPFTDSERFYLIGTSMGGYGTWQLAMSMPEYFAAVIPICGGGMYWNAGRLIGVPVWAFHGEIDKVVYPEESVKMVQAINTHGGNAKLTIYPNTAHDSWTATYQSREVFSWLFSNKKTSKKTSDDKFSNNSIFG